MRNILAILAIMSCGVSFAATTFTASTTSANGSLATTLTWSSDRASCTASGSPEWTGAKAASGTLALPAITMSGTYTLTLACSSPADDKATLSWTAPTKNTDGSTYSNPKSTVIVYGASVGALTQSQTVLAPATTTVIRPLTPGTWHFAAKAVNADNVESALSATVSKVITGAVTDTETVTLTVNPIPNAPTGVAVE